MLQLIKNTAILLALLFNAQSTLFSQITLVGGNPCGDFPPDTYGLTQYALAKQSSTDGSNIASHVIDGDITDAAQAQTQSDGNAWIEIDLQKPSYVEELTIWYPQSHPLANA